MDNSKPTKKDFADLINQVIGQPLMTEKKLDQILQGAKKSYESKGIGGFFDYLRTITQAPVSNQWMEKIVDQMKTPESLNQLLQQFQIPLEANKRKEDKKPSLTMKPNQLNRKKPKK